MSYRNSALRLFAHKYLWDILTLTCLVGLVVGFFFVFRRPPPMSDPIDYFFTALSPLEATPTHRHLRLGLIWPIWGLQQVFGYSELSYYALPLIGLISLVIGTFLLGRFVSDRLLGFVASLSLLAIPWILEYGSMVLPDIIAPGLFTLGFVIALFLGRKGFLNQKFLTPSTRLWLMVSGFLIGWSYLTREFILLAFPAVAITLIAYKVNPKSFVWLALPLSFCWAAELFWNWWLYGNPFIRFLISAAAYEGNIVRADFTQALVQLPALFLKWRGGWAYVLLLFSALLGSVIFWKRDKLWVLLSAWFYSILLAFTFFGLLPVFSEGEIMLVRTSVARYWVMILPPLLVAGWAALQTLIERMTREEVILIRNFVFLVVSVPLILFSLLGAMEVGNVYLTINQGNTDYQEYREFMREIGVDYQTLWLNQPDRFSSIRTLPIYLQEWHGLSTVWTGHIKYYNVDPQHYLDLESLTDGLLVIDLSNKNGLFASHTLPDYLLDLSLLGDPIFESSNGRVLAFELPPPY